MGKSYFEQFNDIKKDLHSVKHKLEKELVSLTELIILFNLD